MCLSRSRVGVSAFSPIMTIGIRSAGIGLLSENYMHRRHPRYNRIRDYDSSCVLHSTMEDDTNEEEETQQQNNQTNINHKNNQQDDDHDDDNNSNASAEDQDSIEIIQEGLIMLHDLNWRVEKMRLEEANTRRFLKSGPRFLPYEECRKWVIAFNRWNSEEEWRQWIMDGEKRNAYIPSYPDEYYGNRGEWKGWGHFLGQEEADDNDGFVEGDEGIGDFQ